MKGSGTRFIGQMPISQINLIQYGRNPISLANLIINIEDELA